MGAGYISALPVLGVSKTPIPDVVIPWKTELAFSAVRSSLLDDARAVMLGINGMGKIYTHVRGTGDSQAAFREAWQEEHGTRIHAWILHIPEVRLSGIQGITSRHLAYVVEAVGWHTYDGTDQAEVDRFTSISSLVQEEFFKSATWTAADFIESWPEMAGPEVVRIKGTRLLQVVIRTTLSVEQEVYEVHTS